jgi:ankyrin repeat protein
MFAVDTTPLYFAADQGLITWVKALLASGVNPNVKGGEHGYSLIAAVINKHVEVTSLLLEGGALPAQTDQLNRSSLHLIAMGNSNEILDCFCENVRFNSEQGQGLLNAWDAYGRTPLHIAVQKCHLNITAILLRLGANPNLTDRDGKNCLHLAAESEESCPALYHLLLKMGASTRDQSLRNLTPAQLALEKGHLDRVSEIEDYIPPSRLRLHGSRPAILTIRLTSFSDIEQRSRPYIRASLAGETRTLYPAQAWPENQPQRETVRFLIPLHIQESICEGKFDIHKRLRLSLYSIQGSRHVCDYAAWCVTYMKVQHGKIRTSSRRVRQGSTQVSLEVTIPPLAEK